MARQNSPFGPAGVRPPARRHPADDPFAAPPAAQPNGHWPPPAHPNQSGYHFPPEGDANYGYQQQPAPFDNYQGGPQHDQYGQQQNWGQQDPRAYDLGNYMPNSGPQPYPPMEQPPFHQQGPGQDAYGQNGYADPGAEYGEDYAEEEEPGRGRRWMFIVAALVGAIGVGGALAYTYKSFVAPNGGRVPLVRAPDRDAKSRPENRAATPGDKRAQGRLGEDATQPPQTVATAPETQEDRTGNDEPGGPRRVRTIPITPGGAPGIQVNPAPPAQAGPTPYVPGIMLENTGPRPQPPRATPPQQRVTIGQPPPPPPQQADEPPAAPVKRATPPAPPVQIAKAPAPAKGPSPPPPAAANNTGAGYVAVLSSQKSRVDALKIFADLQQKYGDALSGKVPDVQEADLSARGLGTVYRLVIGPPGSRDQASSFCSQIKSAGHKDCWVTAY